MNKEYLYFVDQLTVVSAAYFNANIAVMRQTVQN